ncbi:hypothetical protein ACQ4M4_27565 [Leptolyngbya sp. AN02str]|uniref:hypothetical protein n=1 Tax=Leptolyngbya sp. AN02str TaxID=3423363 RepID=UPI003D31948D
MTFAQIAPLQADELWPGDTCLLWLGSMRQPDCDRTQPHTDTVEIERDGSFLTTSVFQNAHALPDLTNFGESANPH